MPDWLLQLVGMAVSGVGAYAAIRADLARLHERATAAAAAASAAHRRIDGMLNRGAV